MEGKKKVALRVRLGGGCGWLERRGGTQQLNDYYNREIKVTKGGG